VIVVLLMGVLDLRNFDGLGVQPDGSANAFRALVHLTPDTWLHPNKARSVADPQLGGEVAAVKADLPPGGTLMSNDGRMIYYAPDRATIGAPPTTCAEVQGADLLVLLANVPLPQEIPTLTTCLEPVASEQGSYAAWRVVGG
jgi:hypothetical protein